MDTWPAFCVRPIWGSSRLQGRLPHSPRAGERTGVAPTEPSKLPLCFPPRLGSYRVSFLLDLSVCLLCSKALQALFGVRLEYSRVLSLFSFFFSVKRPCLGSPLTLWLDPLGDLAVTWDRFICARAVVSLILSGTRLPVPLKLSFSHWPGGEERLLQGRPLPDPRAGPARREIVCFKPPCRLSEQNSIFETSQHPSPASCYVPGPGMLPAPGGGHVLVL